MKFLEQCWIAFNINLDLNKDDRNKMMNLIHPAAPSVKVLSVQHVLGLQNPNGSRNISSKFAWVCLNVRLAAFVLSTAVKSDTTNAGEHQVTIEADIPPADRYSADLLFSISGTLKWTLDLFVHIMSDILDLSRSISGQEPSRPLIEAHMKRNMAPSIVLILSSLSRSLLRNLARAVRNIFMLVTGVLKAAQVAAATANNPAAQKAAQQQQQQQGQPNLKAPQTVEELHAIQNLHRIFLSTACPLTASEMLIAEADRLISQTFVASKITEALPKTRIERDLILGLSRLDAAKPPTESEGQGQQSAVAIPEFFHPTIRVLLTTVIEKLQADYDPGHDADPLGARGVDPAKVHFADLKWLGLSEEKASKTWRKTKTLDVNRKVVLPCGPEGSPSGLNGMAASRGMGDNAKVIRLRRCVRCGARSEDTDYSPQNGWPPWVTHIQKSCICGSHWIPAGE
jgi:hypothetical protein